GLFLVSATPYNCTSSRLFPLPRTGGRMFRLHRYCYIMSSFCYKPFGYASPCHRMTLCKILPKSLPKKPPDLFTRRGNPARICSLARPPPPSVAGGKVCPALRAVHDLLFSFANFYFFFFLAP